MTEITDEQIAAWEAQDDYDYQLVSRIDKLEQLCRDLYHAAWKHKCFAPDEDNSGNCINQEQDCEHCQWWKPAFERRMADLGLIHETEYDPDTGLKWGE